MVAVGGVGVWQEVVMVVGDGGCDGCDGGGWW